MGHRRLIYFVLVELAIFLAVGGISFLICQGKMWNFRALHFIIFQDIMFIIFSILPAMGTILGNERVPVFIAHCALIGIHSGNGVVLIITGKGIIEQQYFVSVACLVFIGGVFTICVAIILIIAFITGDVESIFDEQFVHNDNSTNIHNHILNEDFMDDFENINTLIFKSYMNLSNKCCPICLCDYQDGDAMKILPSCYHTFHSECIKNWFRNQLKCPFCRINITKEEIEKHKDMDESELIHKIKCSESVNDQCELFMAHQEEAEVRVEMLSEAKIEDEDIPTAFTKKVKMIELKPIPRKGRVLSQYKQDILCNRHLKCKSQLSIPVEGSLSMDNVQNYETIQPTERINIKDKHCLLIKDIKSIKIVSKISKRGHEML